MSREPTSAAGRAGPPRFARALVRWATRREMRASVLGDLDAEFEGLIEEGESAAGARRWYRGQALRSFFPLLAGRIRSLGLLQTSWLDVRLGFRMLGKYPGLTAAAVLSLAVGIPVGLAPWHAAGIFEATLPVPDGDEIHVLRRFDPASSEWASATVADGAYWSQGVEGFSATGTVLLSSFRVDFPGAEPAPGRGAGVEGAAMSSGAFEVLQVPAALGRVLGPEDDRPGAPDVVILSHELWDGRFDADPDIVGRSILVGGRPHVVVGVMPDGFLFPYRHRLWVSLRSEDPRNDTRAGIVFGRLATGATPASAEAEFARFEAGSRSLRSDREEGSQVAWVPLVVPFTEGLFGLRPGGLRAEIGFYVVQLLALLILVVACVNISMLLLVRTTARTRELSLRSALGAGRGRIVLQLFLEALVLAVLAAGAGLLVADQIAGRLHFISDQLPHWIDLGVTWKTSLQAVLLAGLSAAIIGVLPALKVTRGSIQRTIQRATAGRTGVRFGGLATALIVADVALAVVVTSVAVAFADGISRVPAGAGGVVQGEEYLTAEFQLPELAAANEAEEVLARDRAGLELLEQLGAVRQVRAVAMADAFPGGDAPRRDRWEIEGVDAPAEDTWPSVDVVKVVPGYFAALGQPVRSGRGFRATEPDPDIPVAIVDLEFAADLMQGRSPVGARIRRQGRGETEPGPWLEVVGLADRLGNSGTEVRPSPKVYLPATPGGLRAARLAIHLVDDPRDFIGELREVAAEVDPTAIISDPRLLSEIRSFDLQILRWVEIGFQAMIAILIALAASGTYALLAFAIAERETEIAIRAALGAPRRALLQTIGRRAAWQLGLGALIGAAVSAWVLWEFVDGGWTPTYSPAFILLGAVLAVVFIIGALAGVGPLRRGMDIGPDRAMRA